MRTGFCPVTVCVIQAPHSSVAARSRTANALSMRAGRWVWLSVMAASSFGELGIEAAQKPGQAHERKPAGSGKQGDLQILAEEQPLKRLGRPVVVGEVTELRERAA